MPEATATATRPSAAQKPSEKQMADQLESGRVRAARSGGGDANGGPGPKKGGIKGGIASGLKSGFKSAFREPGEVGGGAPQNGEEDEDEGGSFAEKMARAGARKLGERGGKMAAGMAGNALKGKAGGQAFKKFADAAIGLKKMLEEKSPEVVIREGVNFVKNWVLWPMLIVSGGTPASPVALGTVLVFIEVYWVAATIYKHRLTVPMALWEHILILLCFLAQIGIVIAILYAAAAAMAIVTCDGALAYFPQICAAKNLYMMTQ